MIKERPEDFIVREVLDLKLGKGVYAYFLMRKRNWNTLNAIEKIAERLRVGFKRFGYAGSKDKNAVTEQYVSVFNVSKERIERIRIRDIWLRFVGYGKNPISLGGLKGNNFSITVKKINGIKKVQFIANYFDEQRFSMGNIDIGRMIVKRQFKDICKRLGLKVEKNDYIGALRKMGVRRLQFYLHSYESYLWNLVLAEYLTRFKHFKVKYEYGEFVFLKEMVKNFDLPLINFKTKFENNEIEGIYNKVLKMNGVSQKEFLIKEIPEILTKGVSRKVFVDVKWKSIKFNKNQAKVKFYLPKGSYATIVLKKAVV